jgi:hypothetical protein
MTRRLRSNLQLVAYIDVTQAYAESKGVLTLTRTAYGVD